MGFYGNRVAAVDFYTTAVTGLANSSTYSTASDITPSVFNAQWADIQITANGTHSSTNGVVTFNFVARGHEDDSWPTAASFSMEITMSGSSAQIANGNVDCRSYYDIKVLSIANGDATYQATALNASISYKH